MKSFYVYILASERNGTLYIGVTSTIAERINQHKNNAAKGFTQEHQVHRLVYCEIFQDVTAALSREKILKRWKRDWKIRLIEKNNPYWNDLSDTLL
jgi:putative endonuclease